MPIEFHCNHCNNLVRAPDDAGGRKAKCPYCKQEVYVPTPSDQIEILELAPVDEDWEAQKRRLDEEASALGHELLDDRSIAEEQATDGPGPAGASKPQSSGGSSPARAGVEALVVDYLTALRSSRLEEAESLAKQIEPHAEEAREFAQQISMDPVPPPELADVPPGVLRGFIKSLLSRL